LVYADLSLVQIEGNNAKADDAIMLDKDGYVSETNATNIVSLCIFYMEVLCSGEPYG
jgi:branched-subunit amino acid aminotransferase/4-amino-4-deoxychorismate lyase